MFDEQAPQLALAHPKPYRKFVHGLSGSVERPFGDEGQSASDSIGGASPGGQGWSDFWAAA